MTKKSKRLLIRSLSSSLEYLKNSSSVLTDSNSTNNKSSIDSNSITFIPQFNTHQCFICQEYITVQLPPSEIKKLANVLVKLYNFSEKNEENFLIFFNENAEYCRICEQLINGISSMQLTIEKIEKEIHEAKLYISERLEKNYNTLDESDKNDKSSENEEGLVKNNYQESIVVDVDLTNLRNCSVSLIRGLVDSEPIRKKVKTADLEEPYRVREPELNDNFAENDADFSPPNFSSDEDKDNEENSKNQNNSQDSNYSSESDLEKIVKKLTKSSKRHKKSKSKRKSNSKLTKEPEKILNSPLMPTTNFKYEHPKSFSVKIGNSCNIPACSLIFDDFSSSLSHYLNGHLLHEEDKNCERKKFECTICKKDCTKIEHLEKLYSSCPYCLRYFINFCSDGSYNTQLFEHIYKTHINYAPKLYCDICSKLFFFKDEFVRHNCDHDNIEGFKCVINFCTESFESNEDLKNHVKSTHDSEKHNERIKCLPCSKNHKLSPDQSLHLSAHYAQCLKIRKITPPPEVICSLCNYAFDSIEFYKGHLHRVHEKENEILRRNLELPKKPVKKLLPRPPKVTPSRSTIIRRLKKSEGENYRRGKFPCKLCENFSARSSTALDIHIKRVHEGVLFPYVCEICGNRYKRKDILTAHIDVQHSTEGLSCSICSKKFTIFRKCNYENHFFKEHPTAPHHTCSLCGKISFLESVHKNHLLLHKNLEKNTSLHNSSQNEYSHNGEISGENTGFPNSSQNKSSHNAKNSGKDTGFPNSLQNESSQNSEISGKSTGLQNNFPCILCSVPSFEKIELLKEHVDIFHNKPGPKNVVKYVKGEKICNECGAVFRSLGSFQTHKANVHKKGKILKCNYCSKEFRPFAYSQKLNHEEIHHISLDPETRKDYVCEICGKLFHVRLYLDKHKGHHKKMEALTGDTTIKSINRERKLEKNSQKARKKRKSLKKDVDETEKTTHNSRNAVEENNTDIREENLNVPNLDMPIFSSLFLASNTTTTTSDDYILPPVFY